MRNDIIIAGHGGQGVLLAGNLISHVAMKKGLNTTQMVSYGVEMRGGTCNSNVVISDKDIGSPVVIDTDYQIIFNKASLERFESAMKKGSVLILNECEARPKRDDIKVINIDANSITQELGDKRTLNMVMAGRFLKEIGLDLEIAKETIKELLPRADDDIIELNKKALKKGYDGEGSCTLKE